jgi:quercetin dioxygenase-like cupin family protein
VNQGSHPTAGEAGCLGRSKLNPPRWPVTSATSSGSPWSLSLRAGAVESRMMTRKTIAIDTAALPWEDRFNEKLGRALYRKNLMEDPDTGMEVRLVKYPAGVINPLHTHPCAHGMYVLEGTLVTNEGSYGPGNFVWFPEGVAMEHGASADGDVTVLFITNKRFEIHYQ